MYNIFSLESSCNHHKITKKKHTPTGTKDNSILKYMKSPHYTAPVDENKVSLPEHILLPGFIFCSVSYELRVQLHRLLTQNTVLNIIRFLGPSAKT